MSVVTKEQLEGLLANSGLKLRAFLGSEVTKSGVVEVFDVDIWKPYKGGFKFQWEIAGKPFNVVSHLKVEVVADLSTETKNRNTFLTSGYNDDLSMDGGMKVDSVLRFVAYLKSKNINLKKR